jgi:hypothetical protein
VQRCRDLGIWNSFEGTRVVPLSMPYDGSITHPIMPFSFPYILWQNKTFSLMSFIFNTKLWNFLCLSVSLSLFLSLWCQTQDLVPLSLSDSITSPLSVFIKTLEFTFRNYKF